MVLANQTKVHLCDTVLGFARVTDQIKLNSSSSELAFWFCLTLNSSCTESATRYCTLCDRMYVIRTLTISSVYCFRGYLCISWIFTELCKKSKPSVFIILHSSLYMKENESIFHSWMCYRIFLLCLLSKPWCEWETLELYYYYRFFSHVILPVIKWI